MKRNQILSITYLFYFVAGACCLLIGSSLTQLTAYYDLPLSKVVLLGSLFALGRVISVNPIARILEKYGAKRMVQAGALAFLLFVIGIPLFHSYSVQMVLSFIGGIGLAAQDTCGPVLFSAVDRNNYATHMSMGQALFGVGNFFTPFLISLMLKTGQPFYYAFYLMALIPLFILFASKKMKLNRQKEEEEEQVTPLYVKNTVLSAILIALIMVSYSSIFNCLCTYTTSLAEARGFSAADASILLTVFNVGGVAGSFLFAALLKKIPEIRILILNLSVSFGLLFLIRTIPFSFVSYPLFGLLGIFVAVLFGIIFTVSTRIGYRRITMAASLTSMLSGLSDIATPLITGRIIEHFEIGGVFRYVQILTGICLLGAVGLLLQITNRKGQE